MSNLGLMQGRLTNPKGRKDIQFFPHKPSEVLHEFFMTKGCGLDYIEWIITNLKNPIFGDFYAQVDINNTINKSGIKIRSICLDYLMDRDKYKDQKDIIDECIWISDYARRIHCNLIVIPIYQRDIDNIEYIKPIVSAILNTNYFIKVAFEFLDSNCFTGINFINDLNYSYKLSFTTIRIGCCFDIGNNSHRNIVEEMNNYYINNSLYHIHIKEKNVDGMSVPLGTGRVGKNGWYEIFRYLKNINYNGDLTLQVARGEDGKEKETIINQVKFIREYSEI